MDFTHSHYNSLLFRLGIKSKREEIISDQNIFGQNTKSRENKGSHPGMEKLIPIINKLHDVFSTAGISSEINLPQIVAVGTQSSGKSSVLESLVGKSFLPRGGGIVTRCPIILKLIHRDDEREWCEFSHKKGIKTVKYTDFTKVEQEVINQTNVLAGENRGITKEPIQITVYSPNVVTLTIVDLPGMVQVAADDQPEDIGDQIKEILMHYVRPTNSIILAISSANNDIVTSESIKLAREVDENGERTLAVLTKVDLGVVATTRDALTGRVVTVKLGIIGVINRSQEDIDSNKSIRDALTTEQIYLEAKYPGIANQHGTPYLAKKLNQILMSHISNCIPALDIKIKKLASDYKDKLDSLGDGTMNESEKLAAMVDILHKFSNAYKVQYEGFGRHLNTRNLSSGAKINLIFHDKFEKDLSSLNPLTDLNDKDIMTAIMNSSGFNTRLFNPEEPFQALVKAEIQKMKYPVLRCADSIYEEMKATIGICLDSTLLQFPKVNGSITRVVKELLLQRIQMSKKELTNYMDSQCASAITSNMKFYTNIEEIINHVRVQKNLSICQISENMVVDPISTTLRAAQTLLVDESENDNTRRKVQDAENIFVVKKMVHQFIEIIREQVRDFVPRCLLHNLIYYTVGNIHQHLIIKLYTPDNIEEIMEESEDIAKQRKLFSQNLKALQLAIDILEEVKETVQCGKLF